MRVASSALPMRGLATAMALAAVAAAADPPFVVLIRINGGEAQLSVPAGADADTVAQEFGRARGLGAEDVSTVARTILAKGAEVSGRRLLRAVRRHNCPRSARNSRLRSSSCSQSR